MIPPDFESHYIRTVADDDVVVVSFLGPELTDDDNIEILGREMFALVDQFDCYKIALDMTGISFITSSVLGKLITLHRKQSRNGGRLVLCNIGSGVMGTLQTSRLIDYFTTADDVDAANACLQT